MKYLVKYCLTLFLFSSLSLFAQKEKSKTSDQSNLYLEGQMTIKLVEGIGDFQKQSGTVNFGIASLDEKIAEFGIYQLEKRFRYNKRLSRADLPDLSRIYRLSYNSEYSLKEIVKAFSADPNVEYAEGIPIYTVCVAPNDSLYDDCQHLPQIMAEEAWEIHKGEDGTEEIIIAIIDTGTNWNHEDLRENTWQNLAEDADGDGSTIEYDEFTNSWILDPGDLDGVDDDENGYIDDLVGWNFINENGDPNPILSNPVYNHGTHCAGIASGSTNNDIGIASISYNVKCMGICADENNSLAYAYDGIIYAAENGADVISNSWGSGNSSIAAQEVIDYATGLGSIVVAAAHNFDTDMAIYPAAYLGVISVASVNSSDIKADYSNYHCTVDITSPGGEGDEGIWSTLSDNMYSDWNGTSMATPVVAGALGLLKSYHPTWTNEELMNQLLATSDTIDYLNPGYENLLGQGRLNAYEMLLGENFEDPYLKIGIEEMYTVDDNGDGVLDAGELVNLDFDIRNFMQCYGSDNIEVTLSSGDPDIDIMVSEATIDLAADTIVQIYDLFSFEIAEDAETHYVEFNLHFESDLEIKKGEDIPFVLLIAPNGYYVYDGDAEGEDYSGEYIYNYLIDNGYSAMYGSGDEFPTSLNGFEGVFLSYGNYDSGSLSVSDHDANIISSYLTEFEGDVYVEGGDVFGWDQDDNPEFLSLFGLASANDGSTNPIDSLYGMENSIANGMAFTGNTQTSNSWIDTYNPIDEAEVAFDELNYGAVAVQYDVPDSYETFCFSYAISKLSDGVSPSTSDDLLNQILIFFDQALSVEDNKLDPFSISVYPNPSHSGTTISYHLAANAKTNIRIMNSQGQVIEQQNDQLQGEGRHDYYWDAEAMPAGVYYYSISTEDHKSTGKIILMN